MRRVVPFIAGAIAILALAVTLFVINHRYRETQVRYADTRAARDSLKLRYDSAVDAIIAIQDSLAAIMPTEGQVLDLAQDIDRETPLTRTRKEEVLRTIADLNASIESSKNMIRRLETRLRESEVKIDGLEKLVENLKTTVSKREETIRHLFARVDSLQVRVAALNVDVAEGHRKLEETRQVVEENERVIQEKNRELSTVYYIIGTRKELKRQGVVRETGGVIGLGRAARVSGDLNPALLTPLDTEQQRVLQIPGKKPVVLTAQSSTSYALQPISDKWFELHVIQPKEFSKIRYLVIEVS